jgi:hypothetical protein
MYIQNAHILYLTLDFIYCYNVDFNNTCLQNAHFYLMTFIFDTKCFACINL